MMMQTHKYLAFQLIQFLRFQNTKKNKKFNFPLLSDFNKEVSTAYETIYTDWILNMKGVSKRSAFIIDKEGTIQYAEVLESAGDLPDFEAIVEVLNTLK